MMTTTAEDLALEVIRVSVLSTLLDAARSDSLSDVIGVHRSVLTARLGGWDDECESHALRLLRLLHVAIEDALDDGCGEDALIAGIHCAAKVYAPAVRIPRGAK